MLVNFWAPPFCWQKRWLRTQFLKPPTSTHRGQITQLLVKQHGLDPKKVDRHDETALFHAAKLGNGQLQLAWYLLRISSWVVPVVADFLFAVGCCVVIKFRHFVIGFTGIAWVPARLVWRQYQIAGQFQLRASLASHHRGASFFWMRVARWITLTQGHRPLYSILQGMAMYLGQKRVERVTVACLFSVVVPVFACFSFYVRCLRAEVQCLEHTWSIQLL